MGNEDIFIYEMIYEVNANLTNIFMVSPPPSGNSRTRYDHPSYTYTVTDDGIAAKTGIKSSVELAYY